MKIDSTQHYNMPILLGPLYNRAAAPRLRYPRVEILAYQYMTDPNALEALLPVWYHLGKEPLVTVTFAEVNDISFMAGGGFRTASIQVEARFDGKQDHVTGDYFLVRFVNQTWPIITGREDAGISQLYADISGIKLMPDSHLRCEASYWGHMLFGLDVPPINKQIGVVRAVISRQTNSRMWLAHKYIPSLEGPADADYATMIKLDTSIKQLWMGKRANLRFGTARMEDISMVKKLIDALATLTILRPVQVLHYHGSAVERYDLLRRLK